MRINQKHFPKLVFSIICLVMLVTYWKVQQDDAYIFYSYASNLEAGNGYVFNIDEKINATTSPLYTLLVAFSYHNVKWMEVLDVPLVAHIFGIVCLWLLCYFSYKIFEHLNFKIASLLFPILLLANPLLRNAIGMEIFLTLMLIMASLFFYLKNKMYLFYLIGALAVLARLDAILFIAVVFVFDIVTTKKFNYKPLLVFIVLLLPWFIYSYLYFGSILPRSITTKLQQGSSGYWGEGLLFFSNFFNVFSGGSVIGIILTLASITGLITAFFIDKKFIINKASLIIIIWQVLLFLIYSFILNPPAYQWYYTFYVVIISLGIALVLEAIFTKFSVKDTTLYGTYFIIFAAALVLPIKTYSGSFSPKYMMYKGAAEWLNLNAEHDSNIAADEVGILRFFYQKGKVHDVLGLTSNYSIQNVKKQQPKYVIVDYPKPPQYFKFTQQEEFHNKYKAVTIIRGGDKKIAIYQKK